MCMSCCPARVRKRPVRAPAGKRPTLSDTTIEDPDIAELEHLFTLDNGDYRKDAAKLRVYQEHMARKKTKPDDGIYLPTVIDNSVLCTCHGWERQRFGPEVPRVVDLWNLELLKASFNMQSLTRSRMPGLD